MKTVLKFGIDEAGRGPLAGPVAVAVFGMREGFELPDFPVGKDSKKMSEKEREKWAAIFMQEKKRGNVFFEVALSSAKVIDSKGIVGAIAHAMEACLSKLEKEGIATPASTILLDGALKAPSRFISQKTIIKGDEKEMLIGCASIVAKVSRDRFMKKISTTYPDYGLHIHKGYGTKKHREAISSFGLSEVHRKSFCKNITKY